MSPCGFSFRGRVPASKSALIRALLLRAWEPSIAVRGESACDDVRVMRSALASLASSAVADCGASGLVLRLLAGYASRRPGAFRLRGSERLLARPHGPLLEALAALGARVGRLGPGELRIEGEGWKAPSSPIRLDGSISSQFLSSLVLNAWGLPFALEIEPAGETVSSDYAAMSVALARRAGMEVADHDGRFRVPPGQEARRTEIDVPPDMDASFAVAALAAVAGEASILDFELDPKQPDSVFVRLLGEMGATVSVEPGLCAVRSTGILRPVRADLRGVPDLLPVLGALAAVADGRTRIGGISHARHKESDRVEGIERLVSGLGRRVEHHGDAIEIEGRPVGNADRARAPFAFDATSDHRMAMAAAVAAWAGFPVRIVGFESVAKSFPEFLEIAARPGLLEEAGDAR